METVSAAEPVMPSLVALTEVVPATRPDTRPLADTDPTVSKLDDQVMVRPLSTLPLASVNVAVNCCDPPTAMLADDGVSVTFATGACEGGGGVAPLTLTCA